MVGPHHTTQLCLVTQTQPQPLNQWMGMACANKSLFAGTGCRAETGLWTAVCQPPSKTPAVLQITEAVMYGRQMFLGAPGARKHLISPVTPLSAFCLYPKTVRTWCRLSQWPASQELSKQSPTKLFISPIIISYKNTPKQQKIKIGWPHSTHRSCYLMASDRKPWIQEVLVFSLLCGCLFLS